MFLAAMFPLLQETEPEAGKGFFEIIFSGGIFGVLIIVVLLLLSILSAYLIIDHLLTCLLYTSPSPRDRTRSRMPSSA